MKKFNSILSGRLIVAISFLFLAGNLLSQVPDSLWFYHFGGSDNDIGFDAIEGEDGIYYLVGRTKSFGNGGDDAYIIQLDNNGGLIWEKTYGSSLGEQLASVCPSYSGGFAMTGYTTTNEESAEVWFLLINADGDSILSNTYGSYSSDQGLYIRQNNQQGYIMTARLSVYQWGDQVYLLKLNSSGDTVWTRTYGDTHQDYGQAVIPTTDGGYIIAGRTYSTVYPESGDAWVLKTDSNGDTTWTNKYGGDDEDIFYCVTESDDGYLFTGQTRSFGPGFVNVYAVKTDYNGDTLWTHTYGGDVAQNCYALHQKENGNYILCGYSSSFSGYNDIYMLEIDPEGSLIWQENYGNAQANEYMYGCRPTNDGGYIITGWTDYYGWLKNEMFALKLGSSGTATEELYENEVPSVLNYPNPFSSITTIKLDIPVRTEVNLSVFNLSGMLIETLIDGEIILGRRNVSWDASNLAAGLYMCKLVSTSATEIQKMVVIR